MFVDFIWAPLCRNKGFFSLLIRVSIPFSEQMFSANQVATSFQEREVCCHVSVYGHALMVTFDWVSYCHIEHPYFLPLPYLTPDARTSIKEREIETEIQR